MGKPFEWRLQTWTHGTFERRKKRINVVVVKQNDAAGPGQLKRSIKTWIIKQWKGDRRRKKNQFFKKKTNKSEGGGTLIDLTGDFEPSCFHPAFGSWNQKSQRNKVARRWRRWRRWTHDCTRWANRHVRSRGHKKQRKRVTGATSKKIGRKTKSEPKLNTLCFMIGWSWKTKVTGKDETKCEVWFGFEGWNRQDTDGPAQVIGRSAKRHNELNPSQMTFECRLLASSNTIASSRFGSSDG